MGSEKDTAGTVFVTALGCGDTLAVTVFESLIERGDLSGFNGIEFTSSKKPPNISWDRAFISSICFSCVLACRWAKMTPLFISELKFGFLSCI